MSERIALPGRELVLDLSGLPEHLQAGIRAELLPWLWLAPGWLAELRVQWSPDDPDDKVTSVEAKMEYRLATLYVGPHYVGSPEAERPESLVHELLHLALWPLSRVADSMVERLTPEDSPLRAWAEEEVRNGNEAAVQDLALAIVRRTSTRTSA